MEAKKKSESEAVVSDVTYTKTPYMKMWKADNILFCEYNDRIVIDLETAKHCVQSRIEFSEWTSSLVCINMKGIKSVSKTAREYLAAEGTELIKAGALITGSALTKMLANIFLSINKPKVPTKFFSDETDASQWLKELL